MGLVAAWDQYNKLDKELEGSGGVTGTVGKMIEMGTWDPFEAHDQAMNEKARAAARDREPAEPTSTLRPTRDREQPQIISPQARAAAEAVEANANASVDGTITVKAEPGTKAFVKTKPKKVNLDLQPSGAW
jgi:hypothetical protein